MVGVVVLLSVVGLVVATWGMSKLSKYLEKRVTIWAFLAVMLPLMAGVGYGFMLCIQFSATLSTR